MMDIQKACEAFRVLLTEQQARIAAANEEKKDFSKMETITVGIIDGDGIGPLIMAQAVKVLKLLLADEIAAGKIVLKKIEGLTIENRMALGKSVPEDVLAQIKSCDVLLKGPTTTPMGGTMESANVTLRRELDLYANVRPVTIPEEGIDWIFYRENTEGEYVLGSRGVNLPGMAVDFKVTTDFGTRRIAKAAFDYAKQNGKARVSIVTKANIMKKTDGKFTEICHQVAENYPGITADDWYIDIMTANLVNPAIRNGFQVFVLPNLYGDIITDEAAQIQGGVGSAGSANMGDRYAMFEAIHGSAPRMLAEGLQDYVNPTSILRAAVMLLRHICKQDAALRLEKALDACKVNVTGDATGATCEEFMQELLSALDAKPHRILNPVGLFYSFFSKARRSPPPWTTVPQQMNPFFSRTCCIRLFSPSVSMRRRSNPLDLQKSSTSRKVTLPKPKPRNSGAMAMRCTTA